MRILLLLAPLLLISTGCSMGRGGLLSRNDSSIHPRGTAAWWREKALITPGVKQRFWRGKLWPGQPRGTGPEQPLTHIYHAQHYWPRPYTEQDERSVIAITDAVVSRGWEEQTTLFDHHFDPETDQLSRAGVRHVEYVIDGVPLERRQLLIQSTRSSERDFHREQSVRTTLMQYEIPHGEIPIALRNCIETGRPAAEVESIRSQYLNSTPLPRIPLPTGFRSGGSGAASQAAGSGSMGMGMSMSGMVGENMVNSPGIAVPASSQH